MIDLWLYAYIKFSTIEQIKRFRQEKSHAKVILKYHGTEMAFQTTQ